MSRLGRQTSALRLSWAVEAPWKAVEWVGIFSRSALPVYLQLLLLSPQAAITVCFHANNTPTISSHNPVLACFRFAFLWRRLVSAFPSLCPPVPVFTAAPSFTRLALCLRTPLRTITQWPDADHIKDSPELYHIRSTSLTCTCYTATQSDFFATPLAPLHHCTACNRNHGEGYQALRYPRGKHSPTLYPQRNIA